MSEMTPEERAAGILRGNYIEPGPHVYRILTEKIAAAIREAVAEEREACAMIADDYTSIPMEIVMQCGGYDYGDNNPTIIAAAIRARE